MNKIGKSGSMEPLVSVIIPVYNREDTILRALNSVLMQTYSNIEVIIVDDCSTDRTVQIIENCKDSRVNLVCLLSNSGANAARNRGIEHARGRFIAFQDSDDEWMVNKLEKQVRYMLKADVAVSYCPYILYENEQCYIIPNNYKNCDYYEHNTVEILKKHNIVGTPTIVVNREVFSEIGMFDEDMNRFQDYEFVIRLSKKFKLGYIGEPLVKAYRTANSITANNKVLADVYVKLLERHIDFLDFENFLYTYFENCDLYQDSNLYTKNVDEILAVVRRYEKENCGKFCDCTTIRYLYEKLGAVSDIMSEWYCFFEEHVRTREFAIYGAGVYGYKAYKTLKKKGCVPTYFIVTEKGKITDIEGIPVIALSECNDGNIPIIIAVSLKTQYELVQNLLGRQMRKFCIYPFCL